MILTLAVSGYRSIRDLVLPLERLNVVTGGNGAGKSSLYRALRLLADVAQGRAIAALALEGGLQSTLWAGSEVISKAVKRGQAPVQGTLRRNSVALKLGFASEDYGYAIDLGLPVGSGQYQYMKPSLFDQDPEIKAEAVWAGPTLRRSNDDQALNAAIDDAFRGASIAIENTRGIFELYMHQHGLLRPLSVSELSDGTLRYLLLAAALVTPRPPPLVVLNEPETSLHPDLIAPLGRLIARASQHGQLIVVTHAAALVELLRDAGGAVYELVKEAGETVMRDVPPQTWAWPSR
jgi:predicted ATPase